MSLEDKAQEHEAEMWAINNRERVPQPVFNPDDPEYGPEHCAECDDVMPPARRRYGYLLCTTCKSERESRKRRGL